MICYRVIMKKSQRKITSSRRNEIRRLKRDNFELQKEPLLSHALAYFLGSALIVQSQPPKPIYGLFNPIFDFLYYARYWVALVLILMVLFFVTRFS